MGKSTVASISELCIAGLFAWWGYHHPFWGMSPIPSALVAVIIGNLLAVAAVLVMILLGVSIGALMDRR